MTIKNPPKSCLRGATPFQNKGERDNWLNAISYTLVQVIVTPVLLTSCFMFFFSLFDVHTLKPQKKNPQETVDRGFPNGRLPRCNNGNGLF